ncbi:MAG: hypothetical protein Q4A13_08550 [Fretibacterium sp.]|nr:hypothetical protein [Fretibacterium sp.]
MTIWPSSVVTSRWGAVVMQATVIGASEAAFAGAESPSTRTAKRDISAQNDSFFTVRSPP